MTFVQLGRRRSEFLFLQEPGCTNFIDIESLFMPLARVEASIVQVTVRDFDNC